MKIDESDQDGCCALKAPQNLLISSRLALTSVSLGTKRDEALVSLDSVLDENLTLFAIGEVRERRRRRVEVRGLRGERSLPLTNSVVSSSSRAGGDERR
jgi:hypothetical protein